ncbi:MAG: acyltransferase [Pirellulales bacterium]
MDKVGQHPSLGQTPRYQSLDAWRGVACLLVVLYHATLVFTSTSTADVASNAAESICRSLISACGCGWIGVPLFFVISGYCITATAQSTLRKNGSVKDYFWRRFRRIFPPYWCMIGLGVLLFLLVDMMLYPNLLSKEPWAQYRPWWFSPSQWLGNLTLTETWRYHVLGDGRGMFIGQAWTLCYEEQFYAVVGVILAVSRGRFFTGAIVVTFLALAAQLLSRANAVAIGGFFFDGQWLSFAAGILVYHVIHRRGKVGRSSAVAVLLIIGGLSLYSPEFFAHGAFVAMPFAALLILIYPFDDYLRGMRLARPLFVCGTMCYSMYLVHQLIVAGISRALMEHGVDTAVGLMLVTLPACLVASLVFGWVFYVLVEQRFLNSSPVVRRGGDEPEKAPIAQVGNSPLRPAAAEGFADAEA